MELTDRESKAALEIAVTIILGMIEQGVVTLARDFDFSALQPPGEKPALKEAE